MDDLIKWMHDISVEIATLNDNTPSVTEESQIHWWVRVFEKVFFSFLGVDCAFTNLHSCATDSFKILETILH
jgi:hypothetical protein